MAKQIPIYECKITDVDASGILAISFVDFPANMQNFVALKKAHEVRLNLNKQKQVLTGAVLVPDQLIYRNDVKLGEYYIKFSATDIETIAAKMMRTGLALSTTTHQHEKALEGNYLTELWIVKDPKRDKSAALGLGDYPTGTLMASYKISDAKYWRDEVLSGNVKGFSLEGFFNYNLEKMSKKKKVAAKAPKLSAFGVALQRMGIPVLMETVEEAEDLVDVAQDDEADAGDPYLIFELAAGGEVWVDGEGFATLEDEQMPAGEHALADGNFIVIDDDGIMVVTQDEADGEVAEVAEVVLAAAKARGAKFLKVSKTSNTAKIKRLETELAALKKQPSVDKARPGINSHKKSADMTHTEKMAVVLSSRLARKNGK